MPGASRPGAHFRVDFDDTTFAEDLEHTSSDTGRELAHRECDKLTAEGLPPDQLKRCDTETRDGTSLPGCVKIYMLANSTRDARDHTRVFPRGRKEPYADDGEGGITLSIGCSPGEVGVRLTPRQAMALATRLATTACDAARRCGSLDGTGRPAGTAARGSLHRQLTPYIRPWHAFETAVGAVFR
jgi:hypothetical protein